MPAEKGKVISPILVMTGAEDKMVLPQDILTFENEMKAAGAKAKVHSFKKAAHSFTVWDANMPEKGIMYNKAADKKSWKLLKNFLAEIFSNQE